MKNGAWEKKKLTGTELRGKTLGLIGVSADQIGVGKNALFDSAIAPYTPDQLAALNHQADVIYADFKKKVAAGRRLPLAKVDEIAKGRVWSGADASVHFAGDAAAAFGAPPALVAAGNMICLAAAAGSISLDVPGEEIARRRAAWAPPAPSHLRGWPALYREHVLQAPQGCDLDFLRAPTAAHRRFVEPVVGRS